MGRWLLHGGKLCLKYYLLEHLVLLSVVIPAYHLLYGTNSFGNVLVVLLFWDQQELRNQEERTVILKQLGIELARILNRVELHEVLGNLFDEYFPRFLSVDFLVV